METNAVLAKAQACKPPMVPNIIPILCSKLSIPEILFDIHNILELGPISVFR
jgi:hypothetical protein